MKKCSKCRVPKEESEFYDTSKGKKAARCKLCVRIYMDATKEHRTKQQAEFRSKPLTKTRRSWLGMIGRCTHPQNTAFAYYGARGITVCSLWLSSFDAFLEDMGLQPHKHTIDRINNNGNYSCGKCEQCVSRGWKKNCRWASRLEQQRNTFPHEGDFFGAHCLSLQNKSAMSRSLAPFTTDDSCLHFVSSMVPSEVNPF